jgi:hypothetical protein
LDELDSEYWSIGIHGIENGELGFIVTGLIAFFMGVCGVAVLFMLTFLRALHREATRPGIRFSGRRERTPPASVSMEHNLPDLGRAA